MKTPLMTKIADLFAPARDGLVTVRDAVRAKEREVAAKTAHRQWLVTAPAPRSDVLAAIAQEVARLGAAKGAAIGPGLRALAGALEEPLDGRPIHVVCHTTLPDALGPLDWPARCALEPDRLRAELAAWIPAIEGEGPPMAERLQLIAACDREIAVLEAQHQNLVDAAGELGLTIQPLESNRVRQPQARLREERERERIDTFNRANAAAIRRGTVQAPHRSRRRGDARGVRAVGCRRGRAFPGRQCGPPCRARPGGVGARDRRHPARDAARMPRPAAWVGKTFACCHAWRPRPPARLARCEARRDGAAAVGLGAS